MTSLSKKLKEEAHRQGFSLVGITTPDSPKSYSKFESWVNMGHHGEMGYLATERALERRDDPLLILPECKSILVLGIHYSPPQTDSLVKDNASGKIAAYAVNQDYHEVLKPRLQALVEFLEEETGSAIPNRWYTDTGPILERDLAQRAGLGWIGKNSMLIHPKAGSYFILAEIFLGIALETDSPIDTDHCGSCTNCLDACPTRCILPNRTLDARRCLSYFTIEKKGKIPPDLRPFTESWIFGCDICQQVCPWNRFAPPQGDPDFRHREATDHIILIDEMDISTEDFNKKFKGSPIKRSKRRGYLRNIAVAIGNIKDTAAIPALAKVLQKEIEPLVRQHAAWALGQIGTKEAIIELNIAQENEMEEDVLEEILMAINDIS